MKKLIIGLSLLGSLNLFAQDASFYYTEGSLKGKLVKQTGNLGYVSACYKGSPWSARELLKEMASQDGEKDNVRVWYNQRNKTIEFIYVDIKCMDDSLDATEEGCTNKVDIPNC